MGEGEMRNENLLGCMWFFLMSGGMIASFVLLILKLMRFDVTWLAVAAPAVVVSALTGLAIFIGILVTKDDEEREG